VKRVAGACKSESIQYGGCHEKKRTARAS
jgi:hypothetical protein